MATTSLSSALTVPSKSIALNARRRPQPVLKTQHRHFPRVTAFSTTATADAAVGSNCHLRPELVPGASCHLVPDLVEGATCDLVPDFVLGPSCRLTLADVGVEDASLPTPVLPSGPMMAGFLMAYRRMLEHELGSGDSAAVVGENVLERVRVGLEGLLHHPQHGASAKAGPTWHRGESAVEVCLWELEKDMGMFHRFHEQQPTPLAVKLTSVHCTEAARLLLKL